MVDRAAAAGALGAERVDREELAAGRVLDGLRLNGGDVRDGRGDVAGEESDRDGLEHFANGD